MHRSQFAGLIIDCDADDLDEAAAFWSLALGYPAKNKAEEQENLYVGLDTSDEKPYFEVQKVNHTSRVHLDIESDDIEAEAARLETLGAQDYLYQELGRHGGADRAALLHRTAGQQVLCRNR